MADSTPYEDDIVAWATENAAAMRAWQPTLGARAATSNLPPIDWENVAKEIEELAKSQKRELASRITIILVHLLKLDASPATDPVPKWRATIREQRNEIRLLLDDAPSLRREVADKIMHLLPVARETAIHEIADYGETARADVSRRAYGEDQVLNDWWPTH